MVGASPFDEALARPFLGEPTKKKLLFTSCSSSNSLYTGTADTSSLSDSEESSNHKSPSQEESLEESLSTVDSLKDGEVPLKIAFEKEPEELELTVLQERHDEITEINASMKQIHTIQNHLAELVDSQEEEIDKLSSTAISSLEHTNDGLSQIEKCGSIDLSPWHEENFSWMGGLCSCLSQLSEVPVRYTIDTMTIIETLVHEQLNHPDMESMTTPLIGEGEK